MNIFPDIASLSTPLYKSSVSIIRCSGVNSINKVNLCFSKDLTKIKGYQATYGIISDIDNNKIDDCVVLVYRNPKSYTGENMVEVFCHGGLLITNLVLNRLFQLGFTQADKGEFTKRAFLNNKMSLLEAKSINDLINAQNNSQLQISLNAKKVDEKLNKLYDTLLDIEGEIEVDIEFPEYNEFEVNVNSIKDKLAHLYEYINIIVDKSKKTRLIKEGMNVVIVGSPNVGKSSLFNKLINENKAIVTKIPGTTRDIVQGYFEYKGLPINLYDTAGIRETIDEIEKIGIDKTYETIKSADCIIYVKSVLDLNDDLLLYDLLLNKKIINVINKIDLKNIDDSNDIKISTITNQGIDLLLDKIIESSEFVKEDDYYMYLSSENEINILNDVSININNAITNINNSSSIDIIALDINYALTTLAELLGKIYKSDLIDNIFMNFCIGK
jgi:tRNA modification GTPase